MKPNKPHLYIHTNSIQSKPNFNICGWISTEFWGKSSRPMPLQRSEGLPSWSFQWPVRFGPSLIVSIRLQVQKRGNRTPHITVYRLELWLCVWGFTGESLKTEKIKFKGKCRGRGQGATSRVQGSAAVQISQWSLFDCSPLKILHSLNLSHIQSLRRCIHRKTWEIKQRKLKISWRRSDRNDLCCSRTALLSPRRLGSARTIFCFFFFFPEVTVSKRCCCCCCWPLVWFDSDDDPVPPHTDSCREKNASL